MTFSKIDFVSFCYKLLLDFFWSLQFLKVEEFLMSAKDTCQTSTAALKKKTLKNSKSIDTSALDTAGALSHPHNSLAVTSEEISGEYII